MTLKRRLLPWLSQANPIEPKPEPWPIGWFCNIWEDGRLTFAARVLGRDTITGHLWLELYNFLGADRVARVLVDPAKTELTFHPTGADAQAVFDTYQEYQKIGDAIDPEYRGVRLVGRG